MDEQILFKIKKSVILVRLLQLSSENFIGNRFKSAPFFMNETITNFWEAKLSHVVMKDESIPINFLEISPS